MTCNNYITFDALLFMLLAMGQCAIQEFNLLKVQHSNTDRCPYYTQKCVIYYTNHMQYISIPSLYALGYGINSRIQFTGYFQKNTIYNYSSNNHSSQEQHEILHGPNPLYNVIIISVRSQNLIDQKSASAATEMVQISVQGSQYTPV